MPRKRKIITILRGDISYDNRVKKEIDTFIIFGFDVTLVVWSFGWKLCERKNLKIIDCKLGSIKNPCGKFFTIVNIIKFWYLCSKVIKRGSYDYIHCNDLDTLGVLFFLPKHYAHRVVYDAHELYPETLPINGLRYKLWNFIERQLTNKVKAIVVPEINRSEFLRKKYKLNKNIYVINNFPRYQSVVPYNIKNKLNLSNATKLIIYLGALMPDRGIEVTIKALKNLSKDYVLVLIGYAHEKQYLVSLKKLAGENELANRVLFYGSISPEEVLPVIAGGDIGIALYNNNNLNNYYCAPNKVFDYIMAGIKVVTNDYPSLRMLRNYGFVRLLSEVSPQAIAECAKELANNDSVITDAAKKTFSWEIFSDTFAKIYS